MQLPEEKNYIESDVLLVHKPTGITSFDVIRRLRRILNIKKIGHAGTLDPLARGLMIVGIQTGTKKMNNYLKLPKTYIAEIQCGFSTDTGDLEGDVVEEKRVIKADFKKKHVEDIVEGMVGAHEFEAPLYSALKVEGKPLYWYARNNKQPPFIPIKSMAVEKIQVLDQYISGATYIIKVRVQVGSGTYIRTLAEVIGKRLGYPATLKSLYRVTIDMHRDEDAYRLPEN